MYSVITAETYFTTSHVGGVPIDAKCRLLLQTEGNAARCPGKGHQRVNDGVQCSASIAPVATLVHISSRLVL